MGGDVRCDTSRVVNGEFLEQLAQHAKPGCLVYIQSDVEEVFLDMTEHFDNCRHFKLAPGAAALPVPAARESGVLELGGTIHRGVYERT